MFSGHFGASFGGPLYGHFSGSFVACLVALLNQLYWWPLLAIFSPIFSPFGCLSGGPFVGPFGCGCLFGHSLEFSFCVPFVGPFLLFCF
jgi:hypothetical protein